MTWRKNLDLSQTIFSLTTGALPCAVAIVKVCGPEAFSIAARLFHPSVAKFAGPGPIPLPRKRAMAFGVIQDLSGRKLDEVLLLSFVAPHSYSGEDTIEFHCHGSVSVVRSLESVLMEVGARPAERGEFSYRALLNGKLSTSDLESLGDVYLAQEPADLRRIYARKDGALQIQIEGLREDLIRLQAILDTAVDFSDEYSAVIHQAIQPLAQVTRGCSEIIQRYSAFRAGSTSPRLVLAGLPNAGKSSLFNAILCRYRAIVNEEPGTTRDVIEEDIVVEGRNWKLVDTAGVREGSHGAELEGISLGEDYLASCSYWVLVVDGTVGLSAGESLLLQRFGSLPHVIVWNKQDLEGSKKTPATLRDETVVFLSARTGFGLDSLWVVLKRELIGMAAQGMDALPSAVQCSRLEAVLVSLKVLGEELANGTPPEYLAEKNRIILHQLEQVIGEVGTEDVLDRVFSEFCIGK